MSYLPVSLLGSSPEKKEVMDLNRIRAAIEEAISVSVRNIQLPGIVDATVRSVAVTAQHLQPVAAQLARHGQSEIRLSAEVELLLQISNSDALSSVENTEYQVELHANGNDLSATASTDKCWAMAWERGLQPIKQAALQSMKEDVWNLDATLTEDSHTFQAAMVLLASELVGPYVDRIARFLGYPPALVQVVAARLYEARIWENDEVCCERWFDPQKGGIAFLVAFASIAPHDRVDSMVGERYGPAWRISLIPAFAA